MGASQTPPPAGPGRVSRAILWKPLVGPALVVLMATYGVDLDTAWTALRLMADADDGHSLLDAASDVLRDRGREDGPA